MATCVAGVMVTAAWTCWPHLLSATAPQLRQQCVNSPVWCADTFLAYKSGQNPNRTPLKHVKHNWKIDHTWIARKMAAKAHRKLRKDYGKWWISSDDILRSDRRCRIMTKLEYLALLVTLQSHVTWSMLGFYSKFSQPVLRITKINIRKYFTMDLITVTFDPMDSYT